MKKKISLLLLTLIFALSFTGCGNNKTTIEYDAGSLQDLSDKIIDSFSQMQTEDFNKFLEGSELEINLTLLQAGLPIDKESFVSMIESWNAAQKEAGVYVSHSKYTINETAREVTLTTEAKFEKRDAQIIFIFDEKLQMKSMTVDSKYSKAEIIQKAGYNTLLGMGTVFAVLILIAFLISLFKYIPGIEAKVRERIERAKNNEKKQDTDIEDILFSKVINEMDDLELVAVITAAIAATADISTEGFVVRSIKRRTSNKWK